MGLGRQDFSGRKLSPQEAEAVIADLKAYLLDIADKWLIKGRFHTDMGNGTLPMEAIKIFWQNWYGFVAEINNFHGVAYQRQQPFFKRHPELLKHFAAHVADEMIHPVLPVRDLVVFPHMVSPIFVGRVTSLLAIEEAQMNDSTVIALTQRDPDVDDPRPGDFLNIGVELAVGRLLSMPDGSNSALVQGRRRVEVIEFTQIDPYLRVRARPIYEDVDVDRQTDATIRTALDLFQKCVQLNRSVPEEAYLYAMNIDDPAWLTDMIVTAVAPTLEERQILLEMIDPQERLRRVIQLLASEVDVATPPMRRPRARICKRYRPCSRRCRPPKRPWCMIVRWPPPKR